MKVYEKKHIDEIRADCITYITNTTSHKCITRVYEAITGQLVKSSDLDDPNIKIIVKNENKDQ